MTEIVFVIFAVRTGQLEPLADGVQQQDIEVKTVIAHQIGITVLQEIRRQFFHDQNDVVLVELQEIEQFVGHRLLQERQDRLQIYFQAHPTPFDKVRILVADHFLAGQYVLGHHVLAHQFFVQLQELPVPLAHRPRDVADVHSDIVVRDPVRGRFGPGDDDVALAAMLQITGHRRRGSGGGSADKIKRERRE